MLIKKPAVINLFEMTMCHVGIADAHSSHALDLSILNSVYIHSLLTRLRFQLPRQ